MVAAAYRSEKMRIEFNMPEIDDSPIQLGRLLARTFQGKGPRVYRDNAILENLTRLAYHAAVEYNLGRAGTLKYWRSGGTTLQLSAILRASTHFETCITNVHRAIKHVTTIRQNDQILPDSRNALAGHLGIYDRSLQERVRHLRNAIQHQEERVLSGQIGEGENISIVASGDKTPNGDGTLMTIDRLELGKERVKFEELVACIRELRNSADALIEVEYA